MTCMFGSHRGQLRTVTFEAFDGKKVTKAVEICEADAKILQTRTVKK